MLDGGLMISWIVILGILAVIAASSGAYVKRGGSGWLIVLGILMLMPGLCGSFFLGMSFLDSGSSAEARAYMTIFSSFAVPSIQLSCLLMWLMARKSDVVRLRTLTRGLGWFGAAAAAVLVFDYAKMAMAESDTLPDRAMVIGIGLLIAGVPFLFGGLLAIRLPKELPTASGSQ